MPEFSSLPGQPALSAFRLDRLLERLKAVEPAITGLDAHHVHLVWAERALSPDEAARLRALLDVPATAPASEGALLWVVPRLGTVSPWASKATDIAHNCAMPFVRRIERGIRYLSLIHI